MIAQKDLILYNPDEKIVVAVIWAGWEYHSNAEVFEGTLSEFLKEFPDYNHQ